MTINEKTYPTNGVLATRQATSRLILHHVAASNCTVDDIQKWHRDAGYSCIGYHFIVYKDGSIWRGRPENTVGAHAQSNNSDSIGICFVGNFETETMGDAQKIAGQQLVAELKVKYGITTVQRHRDVNATACPGANFPFEEIAGVPASSGNAGSTGGTVTGASYTRLLKLTSPNMSGEDVRAVQSRVGVTADSFYGPNTEAAVRNFQSQNGLSADGQVGPLTWNSMFGGGAPVSNSGNNNSGNGYPGLLKEGSRGDNVKRVQQRLLDLTYTSLNAHGGADGVYGAGTTQAVKNFQKNRGLSVDGQVGPVTWNELFK